MAYCDIRANEAKITDINIAQKEEHSAWFRSIIQSVEVLPLEYYDSVVHQVGE